MADAITPSLQEFAAEHGGPRRQCILCAVAPDIERQAREGKAAGITYRMIGQWLESVTGDPGPITKGRLERHFQDGHQRND